MTATTTIINNYYRRSSSYDYDADGGEAYIIPATNEEQPQQTSTTTTTEKEEEEEDKKVVLPTTINNIDFVVDTNNVIELDNACYRLIQELDDKQKEQAARYSYKYFVQSELSSQKQQQELYYAKKKMMATRTNTNNNHIIYNFVQSEKLKSKQQQQVYYAKKMARNHIIAENGNMNKALKRVQETLLWRQQIQIDDMRKCFLNNNNPSLYKHKDADVVDDDDDDYASSSRNDNNEGLVSYDELRKGLYDHMENGRAIIQGYDLEGHAIYFLKMHLYTYFDPKFYDHLHFYLLDRALAATEEKTNGQKSKVFVVFDYSQYTRHNIIPYNVAKTFLYNFERYWPETCYKIVMLDTPFLFRVFWTMIKPLLDPDTKEKILFLQQGYDKEATLRKLIDQSQAAPIMLINGKMKREFDKTEFFVRTPYNHTFNEKQNNTNKQTNNNNVILS